MKKRFFFYIPDLITLSFSLWGTSHNISDNNKNRKLESCCVSVHAEKNTVKDKAGVPQFLNRINMYESINKYSERNK